MAERFIYICLSLATSASPKSVQVYVQLFEDWKQPQKTESDRKNAKVLKRTPECVDKARPAVWKAVCKSLKRCCLKKAEAAGRWDRAIELLGRGRLEYFSLSREGRRNELQRLAKLRWDEATGTYAKKVNVFGVHLCCECEYATLGESNRKRSLVKNLEAATDHSGMYLDPRKSKEKHAPKLAQCTHWIKNFVHSVGEWHPDKVHVTVPDYTTEEFWAQFKHEQCVLNQGDWTKSLGTFKLALLRYQRIEGVKLVKQNRSPWGHKCSECNAITKDIFTCASGDGNKLKAIHKRRSEHWAFVREERAILHEHRRLASNPGNRAIAISLDRMDSQKTNLPGATGRRVLSTKDDVTGKVPVSLFGSVVYGRKKYILATTEQHRHDCNATLTAFVEVVAATFQDMRKNGEDLPTTIYLQLDGASDNKNYITLTALSALREKGLLGDEVHPWMHSYTAS